MQANGARSPMKAVNEVTGPEVLSIESFHANNSMHMPGNHILLCQAGFHEAVSTHCPLCQFQISKKRTYKYVWVLDISCRFKN